MSEEATDIQTQEITEGKATILFPVSNTVFYNNVQVFNRDMSVAVIKLFKETYFPEVDGNQHKNKIFKILEALSATGLRAIRYAREIPNVDEIIANDFSKEAVTNIERNIKHNNVENIVKAQNSDASLLMYKHRFPYAKQFQVIDLDPYGSPTQFLDGAVQSICDGGLLCVTCTDMGALCGNHGEAAYAKYGSMPYRSKYCHEMALRIVLSSIDSHAGRYKRYIKPLISLSADFYIRVFVQVFTSASEVKRSASKKSYIFHCNGCETFHLQPVGKSLEVGNSKKYNPGIGPVVDKHCEQCGLTFKIGGPIWSEPMHDETFVKSLLIAVEEEKECYATIDRIIGVLSVMSEELAEQPLYYVLDNLCNVIHSTTPSHAQFRSALLHAGYKVSSTHCHEAGIKTNATADVVWDIIRCWAKLHPVKESKLKVRSPAAAILSKAPKLEASFDILAAATPKSKILKLKRFPGNPQADWGPKARAKQSNRFNTLADKRKSLQGKRQKNRDSNYHKQFPCKKFKCGECDRGEDCKYSHNVNQGKEDASVSLDTSKT